MQQVFMAPKCASASKHVANKGYTKKPTQKSNYKIVNKEIKSSCQSGDLVEYPIKGKVGSRYKRPVREKKINSEEDAPPKGPRKNNPHT